MVMFKPSWTNLTLLPAMNFTSLVESTFVEVLPVTSPEPVLPELIFQPL